MHLYVSLAQLHSILACCFYEAHAPIRLASRVAHNCGLLFLFECLCAICSCMNTQKVLCALLAQTSASTMQIQTQVSVHSGCVTAFPTVAQHQLQEDA